VADGRFRVGCGWVKEEEEGEEEQDRRRKLASAVTYWYS